MTELEKCMESLIQIFHRYAAENSDGKTLSKKELKKLIEEELPSFLKVRIVYFLSNLIPNFCPICMINLHICNVLLLF